MNCRRTSWLWNLKFNLQFHHLPILWLSKLIHIQVLLIDKKRVLECFRKPKKTFRKSKISTHEISMVGKLYFCRQYQINHVHSTHKINKMDNFLQIIAQCDQLLSAWSEMLSTNESDNNNNNNSKKHTRMKRLRDYGCYRVRFNYWFKYRWHSCIVYRRIIIT